MFQKLIQTYFNNEKIYTDQKKNQISYQSNPQSFNTQNNFNKNHRLEGPKRHLLFHLDLRVLVGFTFRIVNVMPCNESLSATVRWLSYLSSVITRVITENSVESSDTFISGQIQDEFDFDAHSRHI